MKISLLMCLTCLLHMLGFLLITVPTSMQHTSLSPDGKLLLIVGDDPEGILVDSRSGKVC